jgi:hypothetical protein
MARPAILPRSVHYGSVWERCEISCPLSSRKSHDLSQDIHWEGVEFTETKSTFLQQYEVSSGGDWSIHRGGAVYVESAEGITIADCIFNQVRTKLSATRTTYIFASLLKSALSTSATRPAAMP